MSSSHVLAWLAEEAGRDPASLPVSSPVQTLPDKDYLHIGGFLFEHTALSMFLPVCDKWPS